MFPYPIATPQGCNIQTFYGSRSSSDSESGYRSWNKPVGVSHVYMLLIGGGGSGNTTNNGGGSGGVTVWYGAAQHVPDFLLIYPAITGDSSTVSTRFRTTTTILVAYGGTGSTGGSAFAANQFTASGFFNSVAGQNGGDNVSASTTTFLSGGGDATTSTVTSNYGYALSAATTNLNGTFLMQPIIVGLGSKSTARGAIGCGGGTNGVGGQGMVLIASW
jgi:hypothetical protein